MTTEEHLVLAQKALADTRRELESLQEDLEQAQRDKSDALFRAEELENERDAALEKASLAEAEAQKRYAETILVLAVACERALPPESLDESWEVSCARRALRDAYDAVRTFETDASYYRAGETVTRNLAALTAQEPALLLAGLS